MSIRFSACAVAVVALFAASSVQAADLILDKSAVTAASAGVDWTGAYVGGHVGAVSGNVDWVITDALFGFGVGYESDYEVSGGVVGVQGGYNWQSGNMVYGVEGDISLAGVNGEDVVFASREINWTASLRGRLGFAVESLLLYGTAGIAAANTTGHASAFLILNGEDTQTQVGWTVGLGIEAMLADNISAKLEYAYADYGTRTYDYGFAVTDTSLTTHSIKAGVNFHF